MVSIRPGWLVFSLLVLVAILIALFDQLIRPAPLPPVAATPSSIGVTVLPTAYVFLPPSSTPTPEPTETPYPTQRPTASPTATQAATPTPEPPPRPPTPTAAVQRG